MADIKITADVSSIRDAEKALKRFSEASEKLGRSVLQVADKTRAVSSGWQQANKYYKEGTINAKALKAAQVELARELATLNGYTKSNGALNTQRALAELKATESARRNAEETKKAAEALRQSSEQYQRLKATSDPAWASQQKLAQAVKTVREQVRQKNISVKEGMTTLRAYKAQLKDTTDGLQRATAATNTLRNATGKTSRKISSGGVLMQQTGYQVGDLIVQLQSGTNAFVAIGQQATQVAGTLTIFGGKWLMIGSALGIVIPLLTAIGAGFMRASGSGRTLVDTMGDLNSANDALKDFGDVFGKDLVGDIAAVREEFGSLVAAIYEFDISQVREALSREFSGGLIMGSFAERFSKTGMPSAFSPHNLTQAQQYNKEVSLIQSEIDNLLNSSVSSQEELNALFTETFENLESLGVVSEKGLEAFLKSGKELGLSLSVIKDALSSNQALLEKRLKDLRLERELTYEKIVLAEQEFLAQGDLLKVVNARVEAYENTLRITTDLTEEQIKAAGLIKSNTEKINLEYEKLVKPAVAFAEAVESSRYDAKALADMDIDRSLIDAALQSGILSKNMEDALLAAVDLVDKAPELAQIGARMASNYIGRPPAGFIEEGPGSTFGNFLGQGDVVLPTGKKGKAEQPDRIGALARSLATEAEMLESWRSEGLLQIQDFNAKELELLGGHQAAVERLEQEHQNRLNTIEQTARQKKLSDTAGMFGALASIAETGGKKTAKAAATAQAIEGTVNAYGAAIKALNTPNISLAGRFTAYASVLAAGLKGVQSIKQAGGVSAGGSGGSGSIATPSAATEAAPQRVLVEGIGPNDLISGTQLSEIFDRLYEENENRGLVFQIAT